MNMVNTEDIIIALNLYFTAFHEKRWDDLDAMLDEGFTYYTDNCHKLDKAGFINFMSKNSWDGTDYSVKNIRILPGSNGDIAIACYDAEFKGNLKNEPANVKAVETTIFKRNNNNWLLLHSHTSNK